MTASADAPARVGLWSREDCLALAVLAGAWCAAVALASVGKVALGEPIRVDAGRVARVRERIDPNTATVASLRRVPTIGQAKARAIVAFRARAGGAIVFRRGEDLTAVPGIGPGTVRQAAGALSWPEEPPAAGGP
ncbi:MAG TPA: helix-hairpin-helix domain-containing protein [Phycisphaerae bacterium]|nr:helix-hairpin-helix domain-containing protein [Phycisphaerae bacterium]HUU23104.1 helix-hairpin-helix domain-containing protein [Phycisphaerae bacterium]